MLHNEPSQLAELGDFLTALRVHGVPVGPTDIDRLRQLFALAPRLGRHGLHTLRSALLVKTPTPRKVFEALFADWCPDHDAGSSRSGSLPNAYRVVVPARQAYSHSASVGSRYPSARQSHTQLPNLRR